MKDFDFKKCAGALCIILGILNFSWILMFLPVIQGLDYISTGSSFSNIIDYAFHFPGSAAILITAILIIAGIVLLVRGSRKK